MNLPSWGERIADLGIEKTRKAMTLLCLGSCATLFVLQAFAPSKPGWTSFFAGLATCWGLAFLAVAAGWSWGRWFAIGLSTFGWTAAACITLKSGWSPPLLVFGALHAVTSLCLLNRRRAHADAPQHGIYTARRSDAPAIPPMRRAVISTAAALPLLVIMALGPWGDGKSLLACATLGLVGLLRNRTWGVLSLASAGALALIECISIPARHAVILPPMSEPFLGALGSRLPAAAMLIPSSTATLSFIAGSLLLGGAWAYLGPAYRHLRERD